MLPAIFASINKASTDEEALDRGITVQNFLRAVRSVNLPELAGNMQAQLDLFHRIDTGKSTHSEPFQRIPSVVHLLLPLCFAGRCRWRRRSFEGRIFVRH